MPSFEDVHGLFRLKLEVFFPVPLLSETLVEKAASLSHAEISRVCDDAIKNAILANTKEISQDDLLRLVNERLAVYEEIAM